MVKTVRIVRFAGAIALFATIACSFPAQSQSILDKMQEEVASIVLRSRTGIVSIEDERIAVSLNLPAEQEERIANMIEMQTKMAEMDSHIVQLRAKYSATNPVVKQATQEREKLAAQLAAAPQRSEQPVRQGARQTGTRRITADTPKVGSGFSVGDGYIVTSADVLEGMKKPLVITDSGMRVRATVVGIDSDLNMGVLKLTAKTQIPGLKLGDSETVQSGHFAISIGNQSGHSNSVALNMVAGVRNEGIKTDTRFYPGLIQIAGTVGAGTSGAPILNARGEVIGMIVAIPNGDWTESPQITFQGFPGEPPRAPAAPGGAVKGNDKTPKLDIFEALPVNPGFVFQGQGNNQAATRFFFRPPVSSAGFALPINDMKQSITALETGRLVHAWFGVDLSDERKVVDQDGMVTVSHIIRIQGIYPDSPASAGGLKPGDILLSLNEKPIKRLWAVKATMMRMQPGETLKVQLNRNGVEQNLALKITARPADGFIKPPITVTPKTHTP